MKVLYDTGMLIRESVYLPQVFSWVAGFSWLSILRLSALWRCTMFPLADVFKLQNGFDALDFAAAVQQLGLMEQVTYFC